VTSNQDDGSEGTLNIAGKWSREEPESKKTMVLELNEDGSGSLMTMPEEIGVPLSYETDGNNITAHLGSADDITPMEYLPESDQISYDGNVFDRQ